MKKLLALSILLFSGLAQAQLTYYLPRQEYATKPLPDGGIPTWYVDVRGNDNNTCTSPFTDGGSNGPCRQPQAAIDRIPKKIRNLVRVSVDAGSYTGFQVSGFSVEPSSDGGVAGLQIFGAMANVTPTTGTATGTFSAATASVAATATFTILTDSTQTWTVDNFKGVYVKLPNSWATVTCAGVLAADTATVNGKVFTAVTGAAGASQFDRSGTDTQTATNLAAAINTSSDVLITGLYHAVSNAAVVTITYVGPGISGGDPGINNAATIASSNAGRLATSSSVFQGGGTIIPISTNSATALTIMNSTQTAAVGVPYAIVDMTSVLDTGTLAPNALQQISTPLSAVTIPGGIFFSGNLGSPFVTYYRIEQFKVSITTGFPDEILVLSPTALVAFVHITLASTVGSPFVARGPGRVTFQQSVINHPVTATGITSGNGASAGIDSTGLTVSSVYVRVLGNAAACVGLGANSAGYAFTNVQFDCDTIGNISGPSWTQFSGIIKKTFSSNSNFGLRSVTNNNAVGGTYMHLVSGAGMEISNCANSTALSIDNQSIFRAEGTLIGSNNQIGTSLRFGARVQFSSGSTLTGTTEVSLDGTSTTLATMRAASPKLVTNTYGTIIFE